MMNNTKTCVTIEACNTKLPTLLGSKNWETVKQRVLQNNLYKKGIK